MHLVAIDTILHRHRTHLYRLQNLALPQLQESEVPSWLIKAMDAILSMLLRTLRDFCKLVSLSKHLFTDKEL